MSNVINLAEHQQAVWMAYVTAAKRAQESGRMEDGIAAGRAWRRWLDLFMTPEQREAIPAKVSA
ncbi:hypothetical protein MNR02_06540 [Shinella sp. H4-D48]|uniref:hypothetical protein n=1 Tax=Shinella sp. H4-D48 TaxID=2925841 RepID=UPI001F53E163|nr:hypothetical protein [Shinella sp. H4-D48]UNK39359.1 hypothetical protein MNR02_06540 [Shinella sp. H4-D48]